jgi:WD40 repeat protein
MEKQDVFISYNHHEDHNLAKALQEGMEKLAKPLLALRAIEVFRDETSLAANPGLWTGIVDHLTVSKWLVLLVCPKWAESYWCGREALWWIENHSSDRILIVLSGGELVWDRKRGDFDWSATTALSKELSGRFREEPLYVDLRWARDQDGLTLSNLQFRDAVLDLSATIRGIPKDQLDGDDVRQLRKNRRLVKSGVTAIGLLALSASGLAIYAMQQRNIAIEQRNIAIEQRNEAVRQRDLAVGRQLREEARRLEDVDSQWATAVLLAIEALRRAEDADGYELLWKLMAAGAKPVGRFATKQAIGSGLAFSPDGLLAATGDDEAVIIFKARGGREVRRIPFPGGPSRFIGFSAAGDQIVAAGDDSVRVFSFATRKEIARLDDGTPRSLFGFSPDGQFLAVASGMSVKVMEVFTGRVLAVADLPASVTGIIVSADGKRLALKSDKKAWLLDTGSGRSIPLPERPHDISSMSFAADGTWVAVASYGDNDDVVIVDTASGQERARLAPGSSVASFSGRGSLLVTRLTPGAVMASFSWHRPLTVSPSFQSAARASLESRAGGNWLD